MTEPRQPKSFFLTPELEGYLIAHGTPPDEVLQDLIERTRELGGVANMQVSPEQGAFLTLLTGALGVTNAVEIGTFTGYSALCIARGLAPGGKLLCCDLSEEWTATARQAWDRAGVADRIDLRIAPAIETLRALPDEPTIDLAFIDADKGGYLAYYEELVPRMRPSGLILADNVLWGGKVLDPDVPDDGDTAALREFNRHLVADPRVEVAMLPLADGLTLARRR
jgi:caffeoyl-CoA O-methyltransferase